MGRGVGMLAALVAALWWGQAAAAPPTVEELLRKPEFQDARISPRGDYFALLVPLEQQTVLAIMRRSDGAVTATMSAGDDGHIDGVSWIGDHRVLASWSRRLGPRSQPYAMSSLQVVDVDGGNRRAFDGWVVDPMVHDPDRVMVVECVRGTLKGCRTRLSEVGVLKRGKVRPVAEGPVDNARFLVDPRGRPVFSWAWGDDGGHRLFLRRGDDWVEVNDSSTSGLEVHPLGLDHGARSGYLWSQRASGRDVIERIDLATGARTVVASDPSMDPSSVVWSFDGSEIIGVRYGRGAGGIRYFDQAHPHADMYRQLEARFAGLQPTVTSATRDGRLVVVRTDGDREPGRYFLLDIVTGELASLLQHREWIDRGSLAAMEPVEFARRDGQLLDGYLTRPRDPPPGGAPLVVLVHGGPLEVRDDWGFDPEVQMLAARGYAVLQVNFRGSSGRGRAFIESGHGEWGRGMIDDVVDGTRWALGQAGVSPSAPCIWGASYGGYAAVQATVREPGLFRCAIGMAGPYDLPTLLEWGDVAGTRAARERMLRILGNDEARLVEDSPTRYAGAIRAALLIVPGGRDRRVHPQHARLLRKALDDAGKAYEWYLAYDETHGFHDPVREREYYARVLGFLDRHLAPAR